MTTPALSLKNLSVKYNHNLVLDDISLTCPTGKLTAIIGPNGAGKSTLIKTIFGLIPYEKGTIHLLNQKPETILSQMSYIPQQTEFDWHFPITVEEVVLMGRYQHRGLFKRFTKQDHHMVNEALKQVSLYAYKNRQINELSGGQKQRMIIARALAQEAQIMFLDEPLAGIDAKSEELIMALLRKLRDEGKSIFCVHHDLQSAPTYFDEVILLNKKVIASGPINEVLTPLHLTEAYEHHFPKNTDTQPASKKATLHG